MHSIRHRFSFLALPASLCGLAASLMLGACVITPGDPAEPEGTVLINYDTSRQQMDGFGTSTAWGSVPSTANLDAFFSTTKGAGLSILRNRIPFRESAQYDDRFVAKIPGASGYERDADYQTTLTADGTKTFSLNWSNWDLSATRNLFSKLKANPDYQVSTVFSTPWTPPNNAVSKWKVQSSLGSLVDEASHPEQGGMLDPAHYADYADLLADYALGFEAAMGMPLTALSIQNEPNFVCSYESADWTAAQFHDFIAVLRSEFQKKGVASSLKIIAPEDPNFRESLIVPTLQDSATADRVDIVGVHQYEVSKGNADTYTPPVLTVSQGASKPIWMTEWSTAVYGDDFSIEPALALARIMHMDICSAGVSAFVYWWPSLLVDAAGSPARQLGVLGQFSRWVRPGWFRVDSTTDPLRKVLTSVYRDPASTRIVVVAINLDTAAHRLGFELTGSRKFTSLQGIRTSATEQMADLDSLNPDSAVFDALLKARSVTTWYGVLQ